jgi:hypothetical protein
MNKISSLLALGAANLMVISGALAQNTKVCFEAEGAGKIVSPLQKKSGAAAKLVSGGGYIEIPWDNNKTKGIGSATIRFNVKKAGVYNLWSRVFWANGCGNSIEAVVNGGSPKILGEDGTYDRWHWVGGSAKVALKAGTNVLVLKNRETGVKVDQFFLCTDSDYVPVGPRKITK